MTIHIAIPAELRRNADVAELLKKIASGEKTVTDLHEYLMKPITDEQVKHHLRASQAGEPAAREDLFTHIAEELNRLIGQVPQQALGTMQDLPVFGAWQRVITTTQHAAELLWRDFFSGFATEADARRILQPTRKRHFIRRASGVDLARLRDQADARLQRLERLTVVAHLLLLFGIEAALYQFRSTVNARARGTVPMRRSFVRRGRAMASAAGSSLSFEHTKPRWPVGTRNWSALLVGGSSAISLGTRNASGRSASSSVPQVSIRANKDGPSTRLTREASCAIGRLTHTAASRYASAAD